MDSKSFIAAMQPETMVAKPGKKIKLKDFDPGFTGDFKKKETEEKQILSYNIINKIKKK